MASNAGSLQISEIDAPQTGHNAPVPAPPSSYVTHSPGSRIHTRKREMNDREVEDLGQGPSDTAIGQFSFAPTTRTTVVTTTTTTTTSFPPLTIQPPRAVKDLDARLYPLASSPTPSTLRNLKFKIGDKSIVFNEPEDTTSATAEVRTTPPYRIFESSHKYSIKRKTRRCGPQMVKFAQSTRSSPRARIPVGDSPPQG
jgi:F-box and WD-40 domain protein CDC4